MLCRQETPRRMVKEKTNSKNRTHFSSRVTCFGPSPCPCSPSHVPSPTGEGRGKGSLTVRSSDSLPLIFVIADDRLIATVNIQNDNHLSRSRPNQRGSLVLVELGPQQIRHGNSGCTDVNYIDRNCCTNRVVGDGALAYSLRAWLVGWTLCRARPFREDVRPKLPVWPPALHVPGKKHRGQVMGV
jgi:hypothetical protein